MTRPIRNTFITRPGGFTLIELTLATLILAIITSIAIPSFRSIWAQTEMQQMATAFAGTLRYAQQRSVMERVPIQVFVDSRNKAYWVPIEQQDEKRVYQTRRARRSSYNSSRRNNRSKRIQYVRTINEKLPDGFVFEFVYNVNLDEEYRRNEGAFTFYPDGSADAAYFTILRLADEKEKEKRLFVKINPATGSVKTMVGKTEDEGSDFYSGYYDGYIN